MGKKCNFADGFIEKTGGNEGKMKKGGDCVKKGRG